MKQNDYAIWGGNVVQITSANEDRSYNVYIVEIQKSLQQVQCTHISLLTKGVLEACGFKKSTDSALYVCTINTADSFVLIEYAPIPMNRTCTITIQGNISSNQTCKNVQMLDELQEFVRMTTSLELPIDQKVLINAIRKNEYL